MSDQKLLPAGFCDLIDDEARINHEVTNNIISSFLAKNYNL